MVHSQLTKTARLPLLELDASVLGIWYGLQENVRTLGRRVESGSTPEFVLATLWVTRTVPLLDEIDDGWTVWMIHGDKAMHLEPGFA